MDRDLCCKLNCRQTIPSESFRKNFKICKGYEARSVFILANVSETPVENGKIQKFARNYHIGRNRVCAKFFSESLGVSKEVVIKVMEKARTENFKDLRTGNNKLSDEKINEIKNHINSFPRYVSHYKRETIIAEYLNPELNLAKMYKLFKEVWNKKYPGAVPPSISSYGKAFHKMGLKIKPLKTDTCKNCDKFAHQIAVAKDTAELEIAKKKHWDQAASLKEQMNHDFKTGKNDIRVQGICYDLQKVFGLPKASSNVFYYTRNLSVYNLGIHDARTNKGYFHVWVENEAGRGAQEIASCLIKYLESHLQEEAEEIIMWSDSCGGQNRNYIITLMLHHFLGRQKNLRRICLRFLESGHSFNICDSDFANVETAVRCMQSLFTPLDIIKIMKNCRVNNPFDVTKMSVNDFLSCETLKKNITKRDKDGENKEKVSWLKTHEILLSKNHPFKLFMNYDVSKDEYYTLDYSKKSSVSWESLEYRLAYPQGRPLSKEKLQDFRKNYELFPPYAREYFDLLLDGRSEDINEDVDGFSSQDIMEES